MAYNDFHHGDFMTAKDLEASFLFSLEIPILALKSINNNYHGIFLFILFWYTGKGRVLIILIQL